MTNASAAIASLRYRTSYLKHKESMPTTWSVGIVKTRDRDSVSSWQMMCLWLFDTMARLFGGNELNGATRDSTTAIFLSFLFGVSFLS